MILDRTKPPKVYQIEDVRLATIQSTSIDGLNVHSHFDEGSKTFKIELQTKGGQLNGNTAILPQLALKMLNEGTKSKTSIQLAETIDSLGSFLELSPGFDYSSITIFGLSKYFVENIQLLSEIIYQPRFSEDNLATLKERELDKLKLNLEKGSYLSSVNLRKTLFGLNHPYGRQLTAEEYQTTSISEIESFHNSFVKDFDIYISGDLPSNFESTLSNAFEKGQYSDSNRSIIEVDSSSQDIYHQDSKFIQSSIKLGKRLFTRQHEDYFPFILTNEVLGGFFGSRLMKNIREEKGYTYGIYSHLYSLLHDGYFLISTDVKGENQQDTIDEVYKEINKLRTELVSQEELDIVKNYMIGVFTNSFTSPFAHIDKFKTLNSQGISTDFYRNYVSNIRAVDSETILKTASEYLAPETLVSSIAGA
ncbi:M16 family metallopeptidase [Roseivirga sp.]|uniref:M16 family metallopeptidase n=1 Tax=Roseivirga sp. TaxID=1964215 RepID=UPI003B8E77DA